MIEISNWDHKTEINVKSGNTVIFLKDSTAMAHYESCMCIRYTHEAEDYAHYTTTGTKQWEIRERKDARTKRTHTYWQVLLTKRPVVNR